MQINRDMLLNKAGTSSFSRGEDYFLRGNVHKLTEYEDKVTAKVSGNREYRVKLWEDADGIGYSCSCPIGEEGTFCKHCVAVGLAWIDSKTQPNTSTQKEEITVDDIRKWLMQQNNETLVDLIMQKAVEDDQFYQKLLLKTAKFSNKDIEIATYRRVITDATYANDFLDYHSSSAYAFGVQDAIEPIADLIKEGCAAEIIELIEYAIKRVEGALSSADDSNGEIGGVLNELQDLHYQACLQAKPEPEALAKKLFDWELNTDWDVFYDTVEKYAVILGESGLAVYRQLAEEEWSKIIPLKKDQRDVNQYGKRFRITHIMEALARTTGDVEELVAVKQRDLSCAYNYLQIAEIYREAKQYDRALEWAELGLKVFVEKPDSRLRDFLAEEYHRCGRDIEAIEQIWLQFVASPYLSEYEKLKEYTEHIQQWSEWRKKALQQIRTSLYKTKQEAAPHKLFKQVDHSELVRIFLWENNTEAAWQEAKEGGCHAGLWLELAAKRENTYPKDVLPIYQEQVERTLEQKNNAAYSEAVKFLKKINKLMLSLEMQQDFQKYLDLVRLKHKAKRNFMKLLQEANF